MTDLTTEIWVVSCDRAIQLNRVMARDLLDQGAAEIRVDSQMSLADKIALADVNLDNSTNIEALARQIDSHFKA